MMMLALLLTLPACRSAVEKANALEATYDRQVNRRIYSGALASIQQAVKQDENEPRRWLKLAKVQDLMNRPAAAAVSYQRALDLQPYNIEALENLAVLSVRGGQFEQAKRYIDPLLVLQPNDLAGLLSAGAVAMNEKRFADAEKLADGIIAAAPDRQEGYVLRARVLELTKRPADAIKLLEERQTLDPDNRDLPQELMSMYRRMGSREGIRRTAIRLMAMFPNDPRYALESVRAYHGMNRDDQARGILGTVTNRYSASVPVMMAVAGLWRDIETPAVAAGRIAADAARSPPRVRAALADLLITMGEPARAVALLSPVAAAPVTVANIDMQTIYARALYALGRTDEVHRKVDALLGFDRANPVALLLRARFALARGDFQNAATDAAVVASDDDQNQEAAMLLATIYVAQGNALLAAKAFGEARSKFPDSARVMRAQTQWLLDAKRPDEAVDIASAYAHAHRQRVDGWQVYRDVCISARNAMCEAEARRAITNFAA
jgi:tetratricopeptide (TPR) repeat protein